MYSISKSIHTCKVKPGIEKSLFSDRYLNSDNAVCPEWAGFDNAGRNVPHYSFNSTTAGCSNPLARISVENEVSRPKYFQYITLNNQCPNSDIADKEAHAESLREVTGNFGGNMGAHLVQSCNLAQPLKKSCQ